MALVKFFRGTKENYNSNLAKNAAEVKNGIYFITDEHCIMMDGKQYGGVDNEMFKGFIKDVDVEGNILSFKKDVEGTWTDVSIKLLEAADNSIVVGDILKGDNVKDGSTIKVNVKAVGEADGLKLGADGLYVDLTKTTQSITDETARATQAEEANKTAIGVNAAAIAKLNGDKTTTGSVAKAVADAKAELLGDAATEYNTLGKLEDKIQALDVKATKAHTEVVAKADGHVTVAVADSTDKTHKVVTISENDIASATALTTEVNRAKAAEDKIEASVGLAADGSHVQSTGHYTNSATTVVGEIAALDTQVYTNAQSITTVRGIADKNTQDIATINDKLAVASNVTVKGSTNITVTEGREGDDNHKLFTVTAKDLATTAQHDALATRVTKTETSINTLNGSATTKGSVANKIAEALSWIEGGTY